LTLETIILTESLGVEDIPRCRRHLKPRRSDGIHPDLGVRRGTAIVLLRQREGPTDRSACFLRISSAVPRSRAAFLSAATASLFRAFHAQKSGAVALLNPRTLPLAYPDFSAHISGVSFSELD